MEVLVINVKEQSGKKCEQNIKKDQINDKRYNNQP